jgi:hypothetical protein
MKWTSQAWWFTPVITDTLKVEIEGSGFEVQPSKNLEISSISTNKWVCWDTSVNSAVLQVWKGGS